MNRFSIRSLLILVFVAAVFSAIFLVRMSFTMPIQIRDMTYFPATAEEKLVEYFASDLGGVNEDGEKIDLNYDMRVDRETSEVTLQLTLFEYYTLPDRLVLY